MTSSLATFTLDEILHCTNGELAGDKYTRESETATAQASLKASGENNGDRQATTTAVVSRELLSGTPLAVSTDTRSLQEGDLYIPLVGESFDGHNFIIKAIEAGAKACLVERSKKSLVESHLAENRVTVIFVDDTLAAYHALARSWRRTVSPFVIAVTGSSGKTTTKEMCAAVASGRRHHKSRANENNEFGVPKTILSMPEDTEILILELAMRGLGQIDQLAATGIPDAAIITNAGTTHIELLGSQENIAVAKCEIFNHLKAGGIGILGEPTELLLKTAKTNCVGRLVGFDDNEVEENSVSAGGTVFSINKLPQWIKQEAKDSARKSMEAAPESGEKLEFFVRTHGHYHVQDAWCAIIAGLEAGLSVEEVRTGLASYESVSGRGNVITTANGIVIIDESYNANPDSVRCAIGGALDSRAYPQKRKIVVLGEMAELGSEADSLHEKLGSWLQDKEIALLITVGPQAAVIARTAAGASFPISACGDIEEAFTRLSEELTEDTCVMIKGSRCAKLNLLVDKVTAS